MKRLRNLKVSTKEDILSELKGIWDVYHEPFPGKYSFAKALQHTIYYKHNPYRKDWIVRKGLYKNHSDKIGALLQKIEESTSIEQAKNWVLAFHRYLLINHESKSLLPLLEQLVRQLAPPKDKPPYFFLAESSDGARSAGAVAYGGTEIMKDEFTFNFPKKMHSEDGKIIEVINEYYKRLLLNKPFTEKFKGNKIFEKSYADYCAGKKSQAMSESPDHSASTAKL